MSKYVVREKEISHLIFGDKVTYRFPVIYEQFVYDNGDEVLIPSVFNTLTNKKYANKSISSCKNFSITVCQFLNYIKEQVSLGEDEGFYCLRQDKLSGLNFYHLASFLNYCVDKGNSYSTIMQQEKRLFEFYKGLNDLGVIKVEFTYALVYDNSSKSKKRLVAKPTNNILYQVRYPSQFANKKMKEVNFREEDIAMFLKIAEDEFPDILFGVALCMFGGLRAGELSNLRLQDIHLFEDQNQMKANIKKRPELFKNRNLDKSGVKRPRLQTIFNMNGNLYRYYKHHLSYRTSKLIETGSLTEALMLDSEGKAMAGDTYSQRFIQLKKKFLEYKESVDYSEYLRLSESKWSTHICRGIFTNLCIIRGYARSLEELRNLRGDSSIEASKPYWDKYNIEVVAQEANDIISCIVEYEDYL